METKHLLLFCSFFGSLIFCVPSTQAEVIFLTNGDRLTGEIIHTNEEAFVLKSEALGTVAVKKIFIDRKLPEEAVKEVVAVKPLKKEKPEEAKPKIWDGRISAGFNRTRGNVKKTELTGGFLFHRKEEKKNEFHLKGDSYYAADDRKMNAQKHSGMIRFAYSFGKSKKWYNFYKTEADRDRFANINWRVTPSSGIGYWFWDRDDLKLMTEVGGGITHTNYRDETKSATEIVLTPRVFGEVKLLEHLTLTEDAIAYPSLTDRGEYRLKFDTAGVVQISDHFALRVSWINEYNSDPGPDTKEHDMYLTSALEYTF